MELTGWRESTMASKDHSAFGALLFSFALAAAAAIRPLKDGPMIGPDGREFKSAAFRFPAENPSAPPLTGDATVRVQCTDSSMIILVKADLYQNGQRVSPRELSLGQAKHSVNSRCQAVAVSDAEYIIEAGLHDCGSSLTISDDTVIYSNYLMFSPSASYHGIARISSAVVPVSCHYNRNHFVSSNGQHQPPSTFSPSAKYSGAFSGFSLRLMTDDWTKEKVSNIFYLGDILHLEASYRAPDPGLRRLFIDSCVATLTPDTTSVPRYYFIENHGCLADAKEKGSNANLQYGSRADTLLLQLDAFLFHKDPRNSIFITCHLKATTEIWESSSTSKACNYVNSRWENVDRDAYVCRCCESACYKSSTRWNEKTNRRRLIHKDNTVCGTVTLGPLTIIPSK